jgi:hypothetical protein
MCQEVINLGHGESHMIGLDGDNGIENYRGIVAQKSIDCEHAAILC